MILRIKQDRPADQKHNTFYFILGEQWFNLKAHGMRTALVNEMLKNHRSQATPCTPMSNFTSPSCSASMRSPINWRLASFQKGTKYGASVYPTLRNECHFDKLQKDLFITAKSHDVSEILDPTFTPGPSQEKRSCLKPSKPSCTKSLRRLC